MRARAANWGLAKNEAATFFSLVMFRKSLRRLILRAVSATTYYHAPFSLFFGASKN
jgi:hypothetical protein